MSLENRPLPRITPSSINDLECAKKFHTLRELGQWPSQPNNNQNTKFGLAFHQVLKAVYDPANGSLPNLDRLECFAKQAFFAARYPDPIARAEDMQRCMEIIRTYVANDDEEDIQGTLAVERFGSFTVRNGSEPICVISARLDRVIIRESEPTNLIVRDCKTSRPKVDLKEAFLQLWVAKYLYPDAKTFTLEYDWIDAEARIERDTIHSRELKGIKSSVLERVLSHASRTDYPPEPGEQCTFCPLRPNCQPTQSVSIDTANDLVGD